MKKTILLLFTFFAMHSLLAFEVEKGKWHDFEGYLGSSKIHLSIYVNDDDEISGNYCYHKYENRITLQGKLADGNLIELTESLNGNINGYFEGRIFTDKADKFEGTWRNADKTKVYDFKLALGAIVSGSESNRYDNVISGSGEIEVETFMKQVKASIQKKDKEWIANHIDYPLKVSLDGKETIIKDKKQLIDNFDLIFHQEYKDKINSYCVCNMFADNNGVMLGNGIIWIRHSLVSSRYPALLIIAVNN